LANHRLLGSPAVYLVRGRDLKLRMRARRCEVAAAPALLNASNRPQPTTEQSALDTATNSGTIGT